MIDRVWWAKFCATLAAAFSAAALGFSTGRLYERRNPAFVIAEYACPSGGTTFVVSDGRGGLRDVKFHDAAHLISAVGGMVYVTDSADNIVAQVPFDSWTVLTCEVPR